MSTATEAPATASIPLPLGRLVSVGAIIFCANAAMLVLQLVAGRLLSPFIGSSLETWTSIIGIFLAGIAMGNGFGGKLADRYPTPRTLAALLALGAVAALWMMVFPMILAATGLHKPIPLGVRIPLLAAILCLPAGFVLSLLTPLAIKLGLPDVGHTGRVAGLIFALSTLGCLIGNYVTGFYLIPTFTINALVLVSAGALLLLAGVSLVVVQPTHAASSLQEQEPALPTDVTPEPHREFRNSELVWRAALRSTALLLVGMTVLDIVTRSYLLGWAVIFATAVWAASDSAKLELHKYEGRWESPLGVFLGVFLLWLPLFPMYLVNRSRLLAGELRLKTPRAANPHAFTDIRQAYRIVFLASFCGMTLELTASRVLAQQLGVSLFTWTGIIGVMLAGTALGNFTGGQFADRPGRATAWLLGAIVFVGTVVLGAGSALVAVYDRESPAAEYALGIPAKQWTKYRHVFQDEVIGEEALAEQEKAQKEAEKEIDRFYIERLPALLPSLRRTLAVGTVLGALLGAGLAVLVIRLTTPRFTRAAPDPRAVLATTLCTGGAATVFLFVSMALLSRFHLFDMWEPISQVMVWTFSLFFLPMFVLGLVSPQVIRLAVPDVSHAGRVAGRVYAWSTVGAIVGTFAAGYILLSTFGMYRTLLGAALVLVLTSLLVAKVWENNLLLYLFSIVLGGVAGGFILTARNQTPGTVAQVESNYYTIRVNRTSESRGPATALSLYLDRLLHSIVAPDDPKYLYYTHEHIQVEFLWLAEAKLRAAGAPPAPRVIVVGGGGYTFPRYAMEVMPEAQVEVVEIDPKVTQVAREYLGLKDYRNLKPIHMDGRQYIAERAAPGSYDLVIQDAVNDLSVPAHLMTKEYNDAIKVALKPDGVYLLTIIDSVGDGKLWKAAMATLAQTFPPENVVLLTPEAISPSGTPEGDGWDYNRRVMVIYASDKPFNREALTAAQPRAIHGPARAAALLMPAGVPGGGSAVPVVPFGVLYNVELVRFEVHTVLVPRERLKPFTDREPGVILTDQFCPVDNLMAEVFRNRNRDR